MAWIESHQELERHPKTLALTGLMNWDVDVTLGKLHRFWWWCVDYAEDGDLRKFNDSQLGNAVGIYGEQSKDFTRAMIAACWLDQAPYLRVHDWWSYFGRFLQVKYKNMPEKWKHVRELYNGCNNTPNNGCNNHITKPNLTKPNLTKDKETPLPPLQGGMFEKSGDLPENKTANDPSPQKESALLANAEPKKDGYNLYPPCDAENDKTPLKDLLKGMVKTAWGNADIVKTALENSSIAGNPEKVPKCRFVKPVPAQVADYAKSIGFDLNGQQFCDFYESKGWLIGKTPMKNWQAAVRTWKIQHGESGNGKDLPLDKFTKAVILGFRNAKDVPESDREAWYTTFAPRYAKNAKELLDYFGGNWENAVNCTQEVADKMNDKGLDWGWQAVFNHAQTYKQHNTILSDRIKG